MDMLSWYKGTTNYIAENLESFVERFWPESYVEHAGSKYRRINSCPMCGHNDCCTVKETGLICYSCGWSGTLTSAFISYAGEKLGLVKNQAQLEISKFSGIPLPEVRNEKDSAELAFRARVSEIRRMAMEFMQGLLANCTDSYEIPSKGRSSRKSLAVTPIAYLTEHRMHKVETIQHFRVGLSPTPEQWGTFYKGIEQEGYSREERIEANIFSFGGLIVYPILHPYTGEVLCFNTKNPFGIIYPQSQKEIKGFTFGKPKEGPGSSKPFGFSPGFSFRNSFIIVEGENDAQSLYEAIKEQDLNVGVMWILGNPNPESEYWPLLEDANSNIYLMFDNNDAGAKYVTLFNEKLSDKQVLQIDYPKEFEDPDDFFKMADRPDTVTVLMEKATPLETEGFVIKKQSPTIWRIANRTHTITFDISGLDNKGNITGDARLFKQGRIVDTKLGAALSRLPAAFKPLSIYLYEKVEEFYNSQVDAEHKSLEDLIAIYKYSRVKKEIVLAMAKLIVPLGNEDKDSACVSIVRNLGHDVQDSVLKEVGDMQAQDLSAFGNIIPPKIKLSQYFNIRNNDAYFYFINLKSDGESVQSLPYLLRNDGEMVRLDLIKRKDEKSLLLLDNRYLLPREYSTAPFDQIECSLTSQWAYRFKEGKYQHSDVNPYKLVQTIEEYIKRFYISIDPNIYKIVALYIYGTYFYEMFGQYPYLFLNGEKGSGKTIFDIVVQMFALNARLALDISEAALYRMVSSEGGTLILDEVEFVSSRKQGMESKMATILKGGYQRSGMVYRMNMDTGMPEPFDVFCPKIISNISGLDDVIEDRCIRIDTYRMHVREELRPEDPKLYVQERMDEVRDITSRCCLSALKFFDPLFRVYDSSFMATSNARLTQLLTPILAVAKFVDLSREIGGDIEHIKTAEQASLAFSALDRSKTTFTNAFMEYYNTKIAPAKGDIESGTPEGILKAIVSQIAHEAANIITDKEYLDPSSHRYRKEIIVKDGRFTLNAVHLKVFMEESLHDNPVSLAEVRRLVRTAYHSVEIKRSGRVELDDCEKTLQEEFQNNPNIRTNIFTFNIADFVDATFTGSKTANPNQDDAF